MVRGAFHNLLGVGLPLLVAVVAIPILTRAMGSEAFGLLGMAWLVLSYAGELGFGRATTRFVAEALGADRTAELPAIVWTTASLQALVALLAGLALWLSAPWLVESVLEIPADLVTEARGTFRLLALGMPAVLLAAAFRGVLEGSQRFDLVNRVRIPVVSATYALPVLAVWLGWGLVGMVALLLAARLTATVGYFWVAARLHPSIRQFGVTYRREAERLLRFSSWVMVSSVVSPLLVYLDRFLLGALVGMTAVAFYTAPYELAARTLLLPAALAGALFPAFGMLASGFDRARVLPMFSRSVRYVFVLVAAVATMFVVSADWLVDVWLGGDFGSESAWALRILAIGIVLNAVAHVPHSFLQGIERADLTGLFHLVELPVHVVLAWWLISSHGVPGAALAWTIRVGLDAVLLFGASARLGAGGWWREGGRELFNGLGAFATIGAAGWILVDLSGDLWIKALILAAVGGVTLAAGWFVPLTRSDRAAILGSVRKGFWT